MFHQLIKDYFEQMPVDYHDVVIAAAGSGTVWRVHRDALRCCFVVPEVVLIGFVRHWIDPLHRLIAAQAALIAC